MSVGDEYWLLPGFPKHGTLMVGLFVQWQESRWIDVSLLDVLSGLSVLHGRCWFVVPEGHPPVAILLESKRFLWWAVSFWLNLKYLKEPHNHCQERHAHCTWWCLCMLCIKLVTFERELARVSWKLLQFFFFRKKLSRLEHVLFFKVSFASYFRKRLSKENFLVCHYL